MSTLVKVPRNDTVLREFGSYPATMSLGAGTTSTQRVYYDGLREFEPGTQGTLLTLVQLAAPRPVQFFDVGAHIGMHSLVISAVYPADAVHVTAFEPTPKTAAVCRALAAANNFPIRIERCAISDEDGITSLFISPWETSNSLMAGFRPAKDIVQVPSRTLDSYCAQRGVLPSVIKIDVECWESHVIRGALGVLRQARPPIVCEILGDTDPAATERTVADLDSLGYRMHRLDRESGWIECTAEEIVRQVEHEWKDWLFTPEPIGDRFHQALSDWRAAIAECRADTTMRHVPNGRPSRPSKYVSRVPHLLDWLRT